MLEISKPKLKSKSHRRYRHFLNNCIFVFVLLIWSRIITFCPHYFVVELLFPCPAILELFSCIPQATDFDLSDAVQKTFTYISNMLDESIVNQVGYTFIFELKGGPPDVRGDWFIDMKNGAGAISRETRDADVRMTMDCGVFVKILRGETNTTQEFFEGRLKISGDFVAALKIETMFNKMRPKLWISFVWT